MDEDERPFPAGGSTRNAGHDAAHRLGSENLEPYSLEDLAARIHLLEVEIARVRAHRDRAGASRRAAEALFAPQKTVAAENPFSSRQTGTRD